MWESVSSNYIVIILSPEDSVRQDYCLLILSTVLFCNLMYVSNSTVSLYGFVLQFYSCTSEYRSRKEIYGSRK